VDKQLTRVLNGRQPGVGGVTTTSRRSGGSQLNIGFDANKAGLAAERGVDTMPSVWAMMNLQSRKPYDLGKDISTQWQLNKKGQLVQKGNKEQGEYKSFSNEMANITQGVSGIVSGIEQLGIDIPQGIKSVLGGIQAVAGILTGISALVTIITAIQGTKSVPVIGWMLARGGVVRAAGCYSVPGNNYSGDMVPAMLNSGELVLNKAQQGNLASQLSGSGLQNLHLEASVHGEQIVLAVNNTMKRKNKGELATFR
jgi:hypothetical protein